MSDNGSRPEAPSPDALLRAMMGGGGGAQTFGLGGELGELVLGMARENAVSFAEAMTGIAAAKSPIDAARLYSTYLMTSTQRLSRQFMDVTQAATRTAATKTDR